MSPGIIPQSMWENLKKWIEEKVDNPDWCAIVLSKMKEIEKEHGL